MKINELFTQGAAEWVWEYNTDSIVTTSFIVGEEKYKFEATGHKNIWDIEFHAPDRAGYEYNITGAGNAAVVMATIVDIMQEFLTMRPKLRAIRFDAVEPSRRSLYGRMVRRLLPTWEVKQSLGGRQYTIIRPSKKQLPKAS